jgi:outer membrane receptor protein involved in Fe transport
MSDGVLGQVAIGWVDSGIAYGYDEDWAYEGFHPDGYRSTDLYLRDVQTNTVDLRLLSAPGLGLAGGKVDWVLGLYALDKDVDFVRDYFFEPQLLTSDYGVERIALYSELATNLSATWRLTLGLRAEQHESDYVDSEGVQYAPDDDLIGGRVLLEHTLASDGLLYASVTRGYKAGGFNTDGSLDAELRLFEPEVLWNMELGFKGELLDDRLKLSVALFRMQRRDVQIATSRTVQRPDGSAEFIGYTGNGAEGFNQGLEVELALRATDRLLVTANLGFLDTEFENYINGDGEDLDGRDQAQAPAYQFYVAGDYQLFDAVRLNLNIEGRDEYYFSDGHEEQSPSYALVNAALTYEVDNWELSLWGRNLGDRDYFLRGFSFPNDPRDGYSNTRWTQLGSPRQYGISATASF